jgi:hypothetical protein
MATDLQLAPEPLEPLTTEQKVRLTQLERIVEKNLTGFIQAGRALLAIRDERLFQGAGYETFGEYVKGRRGICRSTTDQLCRSTQVYETLAQSTGAPDSDTPIAETVPEVVLRPLTTLPDPDLQAQTWRLAASVSPNRKPTQTIATRVTQIVRAAINGAKHHKTPAAEKDVMFVRPIQRLAKVDSFRADLAVSHVDSPAQATRIIAACRLVADRCHQIEDQLEAKFA